MWHHGEIKRAQLKSLGTIIAKEAEWNEHVIAVSGHKHFRQSDDDSGLVTHQTLSLSGSDRWHKRSVQLQSGPAGPPDLS